MKGPLGAQLEMKGGWIPHQALHAHSRSPSVPPDKGDGQHSPPRATSCEATDFPSGGRNLALAQHKFNTSATLTSLRVHIGLHDHHLLPVPTIPMSPASSDSSGPNSEKPPRPPPCLPSGGCAERLRSGRVGVLPHSGAWLGPARLEPVNPGTVSLRLGARRLSLRLAAVPGGTERPHGTCRGSRRADKPRSAPGAPRSPATAPRPARRAPARTALAPASRGGGTAGGIRAGARRDGARGPPSRPLPQTRTPAPTRRERMPQGPPPRLRGEERHGSVQLTSHPGPDKGYELLGPARRRACVRRSGARLAGLSQPRNYESQKPLGVAGLPFLSRWEHTWRGWETRRSCGLLPSRESIGPHRLGRIPRRESANARETEPSLPVPLALSLCGAAAQRLGLLRNSTLMPQLSYDLTAYGFPIFLSSPNSSLPFSILGNSGLYTQT